MYDQYKNPKRACYQKYTQTFYTITFRLKGLESRGLKNKNHVLRYIII